MNESVIQYRHKERERKARKEESMAIEMTMKQMKEMTKFAWVEDISKADADKCNTIKEEQITLTQVSLQC